MRLSRLSVSIPALLLVAPMAAPLAATEPSSVPMSFTTPDGFTIKGTLTIPTTGPKRHPVVIIAPQFHQTRDSFAPLAERLNARGIATLALDLRGHGESTDKGGQTVAVTDDFMASATAVGFDKIPGDLAQAATWVKKQHGIDARRVALAGASMGGYSVLEAAAKIRPLAILALSPAGADAFGDKSMEQARTSVIKSGAATLVFAGKDDDAAAKTAGVLKGAPGVSELLFDGKDHGSAFFKDHSETMAVFFGEYLLHSQVFNHGGTASPESSAGVVTNATLAANPAAQKGGGVQPASQPPAPGN